MNPFDAQRIALQLMRDHGLTSAGWRFYFDRARARFGRCSYTRKAISASRALTELNSEPEFRDVMLHEIAHALTPGAGHGPVWRAKARELGARPERCYSSARVNAPKGRHMLTCQGCGHIMRAHRAGRLVKLAKAGGNVWHGRCGPTRGRLVYSVSYTD